MIFRGIKGKQGNKNSILIRVEWKIKSSNLYPQKDPTRPRNLGVNIDIHFPSSFLAPVNKSLTFTYRVHYSSTGVSAGNSYVVLALQSSVFTSLELRTAFP